MIKCELISRIKGEMGSSAFAENYVVFKSGAFFYWVNVNEITNLREQLTGEAMYATFFTVGENEFSVENLSVMQLLSEIYAAKGVE